MNAAGYSGTPLVKKLGIKEGYKIRLINQPENYFELLIHLPEDILILKDKKIKKNFIHLFATKAKELQAHLTVLKNEIEQDGMIWVSWPKKVSRVPTDITEDFIREIALRNQLVDVKVCAIDEIWSGLKLVIPIKNRL